MTLCRHRHGHIPGKSSRSWKEVRQARAFARRLGQQKWKVGLRGGERNHDFL